MSSFHRVIKAEQVKWTPSGQITANALRPVMAVGGDAAKLATATANIQAQQIVQAAREQAQELLQAAQEQAAETLNQARARGLQSAEAETADLLLSAHGLIDEVEAWRQKLLRKNEPLVIELVSAVARKLFGDGLALPADTLQQAFDQALAEARPLGALRIHLNPADAAVLGPQWPAAGSVSQGLEMVPDTTIRRGGCLIEGDYGQVDARVDAQLTLTLDALTKAGAEAAESGEHLS